MINKLIKLKEKKYFKFLMFCFVGGIAALIDFTVFNIFSFFLGKELIMLQISRVIAIVVSMNWNFFINRRVTFKAHNEKVRKQLPRWLTLYVITSLINLFIFTVVILLIGGGFWQRNIAYVLGIAVSIPLNFIGSSLWAFKKKD